MGHDDAGWITAFRFLLSGSGFTYMGEINKINTNMSIRTLYPLVIPGLLLLLIMGCTGKSKEVERAIYYWKSNNYWLTDQEDTILQKTDIRKVYVKYFEVQAHPTLGNAPMSKSNLNLNWFVSRQIERVPVVFIENRVLKNISRGALDTLADNIVFLAKKYSATYQSPNSWVEIQEMQIDCDWTPSTTENYFYLLKQIKTLSKLKISATLRLYPYAYPEKMGIPPVDKVMLMCYNLLPPLKHHDKNSILDLDELQAYLKRAKRYPIHIDIALPVFSWMHHYSNNQFKSLINKNPDAYHPVLAKTDALWSEVVTDSVIDQTYFRAGDRLKTEKIDIALLKKATQMIRKHVHTGNKITVSLFHLDEDQLNQYSHEELEAVFAAFGR
jgi:hypothetical protein